MFKNVPPAALALGLSAVSTLLAWPALAQNHQHRAMPMPAAAPAATSRTAAGTWGGGWSFEVKTQKEA